MSFLVLGLRSHAPISVNDTETISTSFPGFIPLMQSLGVQIPHADDEFSSDEYFPPLVIGMALLTQPAIAATVGWLAFGELLEPLDIFGMVLVGAALVLARAPGKAGRVR